MPLKILHRKEQEVPKPTAQGKVNRDLEALKAEMAKLKEGMVLEIETGGQKGVRGTKMLVTRASKELGQRWRHWHEGARVFARPIQAVRRRRRRKAAK